MRKIILILGMIGFFGTASAEQTNDTIQQLLLKIDKLENMNSGLSKQLRTANSNIKKLESRVSAAVDSLDALKEDIALTNSNVQAMSESLELKIRQLSNKTDDGFSLLNKRAVFNTILHWTLSVLAIILISAILFGRLKRSLTLVKTDLSAQIKKSSDSIQEEIIKLDNKVYWSLDFQNEMSKTEQTETGEIDHSLALKVADEIIRIQKHINSMDPDTKGLKQLEFAVERIQDNFRENGYEMVELLNKPYSKEMKLSAKFKPDSNLKQGEQIITRIIKPQINFNSHTIQEAQVEVSIGE
jgi:hypothetical protein